MKCLNCGYNGCVSKVEYKVGVYLYSCSHCDYQWSDKVKYRKQEQGVIKEK